MSRAKRLLEAESFLARAMEECRQKYGMVPSAFIVAMAAVPDDQGRFRNGRKPFLYRYVGHPGLAAKMAEWVADDLECEPEGEEEDEDEKSER